MKETKEKIKTLFYEYMKQVFNGGLLEDPREFYFKTFVGTVKGENRILTDITVYDIYDENNTHYGTITSEVSYDSSENITFYTQWAQMYGDPTALEFEDLERTIYDMIVKRDRFDNIKIQ